MKNFKKIASAIAALSLAACMVAPVAMTSFAATGGDNTITINGHDTSNHNDDGVHTLEAYQIFTGKYENDVLINIGWGDAVKSDEIEALLTELQAENAFKFGTETNVFAGIQVTDKDCASKVAAALGSKNASETANFENDEDAAKKFADIIFKYIDTSKKSGSHTAGATTITNLPDGYYLIEDSADSPSQPTVGGDGADTSKNQGARTRHILQVAGGTTATIQIKSSAPSVEKKVYEDDKYEGSEYGAGYNDVADHTIGDEIGFKLIGSLPSTYDDYTVYYYEFTDTYAETLDTIDDGETTDADDFVDVVVKVVNKGAGGNYDYDSADNKTIPSTLYEVSEDTANHKFTVKFADLKATTLSEYGITKDSKIVVEYKAKLTSGAVIGLPGQENKVDLTYSSNPNYKGYGDTGTDEHKKTPEDKVIVFTYEVDINKTDGTAPLTGAKFVLSRKKGDSGVEYAVVNSNGQLTGWTDTKPTVGADGTITDTGKAILPEMTGGTAGKFKIQGLDDKETYTLEEIQAPSGFNKLEDTYALILDANTENGQTWNGEASSALKDDSASSGAKGLVLKYKFTNAEGSTTDVDAATDLGSEAMDVINQKGASLPSTGGIGTTLFYLGGGALVAVAGVMLITKKRMTKE